MEKQHLIDLTNVVYKLTLLFPKKEPLRYKMREAADDILATFIKGTKQDSVPGNVTWQGHVTLLEVMDGFLEVAKAQNWVEPDQLLEIQKEYAKLRKSNPHGAEPVTKRPEVGRPSEAKGARYAKRSEHRDTYSERQEKILDFLKEQGRAQVWQIKNILPEVTKRTLRRDFEALLKQGLIERMGERNNTFYQIPSEGYSRAGGDEAEPQRPRTA